MNPPFRQAPFFVLLLVLMLGSACKPKLTPEQQAVRTELRQALQKGDFAPAAPLAQRVVDFAPRDAAAWDDLVQAQLGLRDLPAAQESLRKWKAATGKQSPRWWELSGDLALAQGNPDAALQEWTKALPRKPRNPALLRKIAQLHHTAGRWAEEEAALTRVLALEDSASVRLERAYARRRLHLWSGALEDVRQAQALEPDAPGVREATQLFERLAKFLTGIQDLDERLLITPGDAELLADRALIFLRAGDPALALADSEAAAQLAPWAMRPRFFAGLALLEMNRAADAEALGLSRQAGLAALTPEFLETISRLDAEIAAERDNAELYVARAWQLNDLGQPGLALQDTRTALRFDPNSASAHAELAYAEAKLGRPDEAYAEIKRATELDENFSTAWHYRGELEMSRGELEPAVASFTRALAINQTPAVLQKREECYIKLGQFEKAETDHRLLETLR